MAEKAKLGGEENQPRQCITETSVCSRGGRTGKTCENDLQGSGLKLKNLTPDLDSGGTPVKGNGILFWSLSSSALSDTSAALQHRSL